MVAKSHASGSGRRVPRSPPGTAPRVSGAFNPVKPRDVTTPKRCVAELFDEAGGVKAVMVTLDIGKTQAYAFTDPAEPEQISFARVASLTGPDTAAAARYLAHLAGGVFCPMPKAEAGAGPLELTSEAARSHGEALAVVIDSLKDNRITPDEARKALAELDEAMSDLAALRGHLVEAKERSP